MFSFFSRSDFEEPVPPLEDAIAAHRRNKSQQTAAYMAVQGLDDLPFHKALNAVRAHLMDRRDIDPAALDKFANEMGRLAHMRGRK